MNLEFNIEGITLGQLYALRRVMDDYGLDYNITAWQYDEPEAEGEARDIRLTIMSDRAGYVRTLVMDQYGQLRTV